MRRRVRFGLLITLGVAASAILGFLVVRPSPPSRSVAELLESARSRYRSGQYAAAERLALNVLEDEPGSAPALRIAAEAATKQGHLDRALEYYARIPAKGTTESLAAAYGAGEILIHQGRLSEGESKLRLALELDSGHIPSLSRLTMVLGITGRSWEAIPFAMRLARGGRAGVQHLLLLGDVERPIHSGDTLQRCRAAAPHDPLPLLAEARIAVSDDRLDAAEKLLRKVVSIRPAELEAHALLGDCLLRKNADLAQWRAQLPANADRHPGIWVVRSEMQIRRGERRSAVRCLIEAVRRAPNHRTANYRAGQLLRSLGRPKLAAPFLERADRLRALSMTLDGVAHSLSTGQIDPQTLQRVVADTESLGRLWEAWNWTNVALARFPRSTWAISTERQLRGRLHDGLPRTLPDSNPARLVNVAEFPLPAETVAAKPPGGEVSATGVQMRFVDDAVAAGIDFTYLNAADPRTPGARIFETTGGGVAAFDYDGDGWPDLYFTQGSSRPPSARLGTARDQFYRNLGNGSFHNITSEARLGAPDFSQGVNVGDFDADGFPDLYVGNLGRNRLYHNNGDGTFTDVTETATLRDDRWTTSCLVADLNGDGLPDLYDVNYVAGGDLSRICRKERVATACAPRAFPAAQDRVLLNDGSGGFRDVTGEAGIEAPNGYGLGIVAADFDGSGRISLFVANDQTPNFYFLNRTQRDGKLSFAECALSRGLADDEDGKSQGCMGIAAGDANGDGRLDLFVTNFHNESNALYVSDAGAQFLDVARRSGLRAASFPMVGFGTQFLDGDLDGRPDLVVANGHIDDLSSLGVPFRMSPQYFRNRGAGRFALIRPDSKDDYFRSMRRGRGLARLDWNRDGKEDFAVSHLDSPASLVTNRTTTAGHYLSIRLRGVRGSRDAIGTTVTVTCGRRRLTRQLTAGDGYQACNQRQLVFGLGAQQRVAELRIAWAGREEQVFRDVPADAEIVVVEGASRPLRLPKD